jgi:hypothetical protein
MRTYTMQENEATRARIAAQVLASLIRIHPQANDGTLTERAVVLADKLLATLAETNADPADAP